MTARSPARALVGALLASVIIAIGFVLEGVAPTFDSASTLAQTTIQSGSIRTIILVTAPIHVPWDPLMLAGLWIILTALAIGAAWVVFVEE